MNFDTGFFSHKPQNYANLFFPFNQMLYVRLFAKKRKNTELTREAGWF